MTGEILRRITGRTLGSYFRTQIGEPLDIDFYYGLPDNCTQRVANLDLGLEYPFRNMPRLAVNVANQFMANTPSVFLNPIIKSKDTRGARFRNCEIPGTNGHGNARSLAQIASLFSASGHGERPLISKTVLEQAITPQFQGKDAVMHQPISWGLGFALEPDRSLFWNGYGGAHLYSNIEKDLHIGYAMNRGIPSFVTDRRVIPLKEAVFRCL